VRRLTASGYNVIAAPRREGDELRHAVCGVGQDLLKFRAFDLSEIDAIPAFVRAQREAFGAIFGLVNSDAGIGHEGLLATMYDSDIEALVRLNCCRQLF